MSLSLSLSPFDIISMDCPKTCAQRGFSVQIEIYCHPHPFSLSFSLFVLLWMYIHIYTYIYICVMMMILRTNTYFIELQSLNNNKLLSSSSLPPIPHGCAISTNSRLSTLFIFAFPSLSNNVFTSTWYGTALIIFEIHSKFIHYDYLVVLRNQANPHLLYSIVLLEMRENVSQRSRCALNISDCN